MMEYVSTLVLKILCKISQDHLLAPSVGLTAIIVSLHQQIVTNVKLILFFISQILVSINVIQETTLMTLELAQDALVSANFVKILLIVLNVI